MLCANKTPVKLTPHNLHPKVPSSKSLTMYIKELNEAEKLEKKNADCSLSGIELQEEDPTKLNNILNALKATSKGTLPYLPSSKRMDTLGEVCDFKNIGDLNNISFIEDNLLPEVSSEKDREEKNDLNSETTNKYLRPDMERVSEDSSQEYQELSVLNLEILMDQLELQQTKIIEAQTHRLRVRDGYLQKLLQIRSLALHNYCKALTERKQLRLAQQKQLEEIEMQADIEIKLAEKNYSDWRSQLEEELARNYSEYEKQLEEELATKNAEEDHSATLVTHLESSLAVFKELLLSVQARAENHPRKSEAHQLLYEELPSIMKDFDNESNATLDEKIERLAYAHHLLLDVDATLQAELCSPPVEGGKQMKEDNKIVSQPPSAEELLDQQKEPDLAPPALKPQVEDEPPPQLSKELPVEESAPETRPHTEEAERMVEELRKKWEEVSREADATRENSHLRPMLSRVVGVVNTLNSERHDTSNRGKLQQLLNLLAGRTCTVGEESVSTKGNASAQAFVREQLASRLVTLAHDKQAASMGVYASLMVRLWQLHPHVGELILFRLLEACPFLAPRGLRRSSSQTDAQFHQSLGFRQREGGPREPVDKYLTRMAQLAQLYGRIVAMEVEGDHPHGLHNGWTWIACTLSLPPYPSVTAALLRGFLSTAGAPLLAHYGRQFRKMLNYLSTCYLPKIEEDALEGGQADIAALKTLLREYEQTGTLPTLHGGHKLML